MDAYINSKVLAELASSIFDCERMLECCIITIKAQFKMADAFLAGEQFERFKDKVDAVCESIAQTIDELRRAKAFLNALEPEIIGYDGTKY